MKYILNIMKILIRTILLTGAIYWGSIYANSDDVNIGAAVAFGVASLGFVMTTDGKK